VVANPSPPPSHRPPSARNPDLPDEVPRDPERAPSDPGASRSRRAEPDRVPKGFQPVRDPRECSVALFMCSRRTPPSGAESRESIPGPQSPGGHGFPRGPCRRIRGRLATPLRSIHEPSSRTCWPRSDAIESAARVSAVRRSGEELHETKLRELSARIRRYCAEHGLPVPGAVQFGPEQAAPHRRVTETRFRPAPLAS
jgi:hypothetical protein